MKVKIVMMDGESFTLEVVYSNFEDLVKAITGDNANRTAFISDKGYINARYIAYITKAE